MRKTVILAVLLLAACNGKEKREDVLYLKKSEWACTNMTRTVDTMYVKSGDILIPITSYDDVCLTWSRQP